MPRLRHCLCTLALPFVFRGAGGLRGRCRCRSSVPLSLFLSHLPAGCRRVAAQCAFPGACYSVVFLLRSTPPSTCACLCLGVQSIRGFSERPLFCLCQQDPSGFYRQYLRVWGLLWSHTSRSCVVISQE